MDKLQKLGKGNALPRTNENTLVVRENLNDVIDKTNQIIDSAITNEGDLSGTPVKKIVRITAEGYAALPTIDENTMYVIITS